MKVLHSLRVDTLSGGKTTCAS